MLIFNPSEISDSQVQEIFGMQLMTFFTISFYYIFAYLITAYLNIYVT